MSPTRQCLNSIERPGTTFAMKAAGRTVLRQAARACVVLILFISAKAPLTAQPILPHLFSDQEAGLTGPDQDLPASIRVKHGANALGKTIYYYFNYSSAPETITYPYGAGVDLLAQAPVAHGQTISLKPWDVAIIEER